MISLRNKYGSNLKNNDLKATGNNDKGIAIEEDTNDVVIGGANLANLNC